jgi:hypothetical protein
MTDTSITHYRIYCNTESEWSYGYLATADGEPTACFNDIAHTVNANSVQPLEVISNETIKVKIQEEYVPTGGNFRCEGKKFTIAANTTTSQTVSWPYNISVLQSFFTSTAEQEGNILDVVTGPATVVGTLTSSIASGVTVLPVSLTVIQNMNLGYEVLIGSDLLGEVISIDENALTLTIGTATGSAYTEGAYVKLQVINIKNFEITGESHRVAIGASKTGGKHLPANLPVKLTYQNNTNTEIVFRYQIEYLY